MLGIIPDPSRNPVMHYFGENYIFGRQQQQMLNDGSIMRAPSRFPPATWIYCDATLAGGSLADNLCEGWNNALATFAGAHHPSLFKLILDFQK